MEYYLFATNDCNLNCTYCSVILDAKQNNMPMNPTYSLKDLNDFIEQTQCNSNDEEIKIVFFGGEPTLNYDFISDVIAAQGYLQRLYLITYVLHTNGVILDKIPKSLLANISIILVSINYMNIPQYNLHEGYFSTIIEGLRFVRKHNPTIKTIGRFTVTERTSLYLESSSLHPFFDYIYWQIENCHSFQNFQYFYKAYTYDLQMLFDIWVSYLKRGILLRIIPFMAGVACAGGNSISDDFTCGYNKSMIYIQTDGRCYTCAEDMMSANNLVGHIKTGFQFDGYSVNNSPLCVACNFRPLCNGRCARMWREFEQSHATEYCQLNKFMFTLITDKYDVICKALEQHNLNIDLTEPLFHLTELVP